MRNSKIRSQIREMVGLGRTHNDVRIVIVTGYEPPRLCGARGGWFTRGGTRIAHPGSYGRKGWSNMVYRTSTRRILVGAGYLFSQGVCPAAVNL